MKKKGVLYSHTLEKRSSAPPPNPPAGLEVVVEVVPEETGAALVQPPKSSSAATVGVGLDGAPQPLPISLAVKVSGRFIMLEVDDTAGAGAGAGTGSGLPHALPPQGSMLADMTPPAAAVATGTVGLAGAGGWMEGLERLNAELISCWGDEIVGLGGAAGAAGAGGGEDRPNKSFERDEGGLGFAGLVDGEAKPPKPKSCPPLEIEALRDWGLCADRVGEVKLSNRSPLAEPEGEVTLGAAGVDLVFEKLARLANGDGFSAGLAGGGEVVEGKLSPLKASVRPPMFDAVEEGGGEAKSPKELIRAC